MLEGADRKAFIDEMSPIVLNTVRSMIALADKHNVDRDNAVQYFSTIFSTMAKVSTFTHFEEGTSDPH